jgi:hypothetical protein
MNKLFAITAKFQEDLSFYCVSSANKRISDPDITTVERLLDSVMLNLPRLNMGNRNGANPRVTEVLQGLLDDERTQELGVVID